MKKAASLATYQQPSIGLGVNAASVVQTRTYLALTADVKFSPMAEKQRETYRRQLEREG